MAEIELLEQVTEIIAKACHCDKFCEGDCVDIDLMHCGCQEDALEIIELVRKLDKERLDKFYNTLGKTIDA